MENIAIVTDSLSTLPDNPGPAHLPCQADSSISSIPSAGACSCGTDRKRNSWQICKNRLSGSADREPCYLQRGQDTSQLSTQWRREERKRWIPDSLWPNLETGAGPTDRCLPPAHMARWSECPSERELAFQTLPPVWVRASWPNTRPRHSVLHKICRETSADMAACYRSGGQAVGLGRKLLPDSAESFYRTASFVASVGPKIRSAWL